MTKQNNEFVTCATCGQKSIRSMNKHKYIRMDGTIQRCRVCDWIKRMVEFQ